MQPHSVITILPLLLSLHQIIKLTSESTSVLVSVYSPQITRVFLVNGTPNPFFCLLQNPLDVKNQVERSVIHIINNLAVSLSKRCWFVQITHLLIPFYLLHISLIVRFAPIRGIYLLKQGQTAYFFRLFKKMVPFELHIWFFVCSVMYCRWSIWMVLTTNQWPRRRHSYKIIISLFNRVEKLYISSTPLT